MRKLRLQEVNFLARGQDTGAQAWSVCSASAPMTHSPTGCRHAEIERAQKDGGPGSVSIPGVFADGAGAYRHGCCYEKPRSWTIPSLTAGPTEA